MAPERLSYVLSTLRALDITALAPVIAELEKEKLAPTAGLHPVEPLSDAEIDAAYRATETEWIKTDDHLAFENVFARAIESAVSAKYAARIAELEASEQAVWQLYDRMKNCAAGYSNFRVSGSESWLDEEFEQVDSDARAALAARGKHA